MTPTAPSAHHVGITVDDLDRAVAFYRDVLGLAVVDRFQVSGAAFAAVDVADAAAEFVHLETDGVRVELVAYDPAGTDPGVPRLNRPGTAHLGLTVEDVDEFVSGLPDDVDRVSDPRTTATGTRLVFLRDPEGNLVELLEA